MTVMNIFTGHGLWSIWSEALRLRALPGAAQNFEELEPCVQKAWEATAMIAEAKARTTPQFRTKPADPLFRRRVGRFLVARDLLEATDESMLEFFGNFVILESRLAFGLTYSFPHFEYTAISPLFDVLPEGIFPPLYDIHVTLMRGDDDLRAFSFSATRHSPKDDQP